ncbi:MAG: Xaa-Pro peptidase family protein, partial [Clostridia bacterium]|nr:Xaa-Pro peptidase family protein [Clostridia bacterium]
MKPIETLQNLLEENGCGIILSENNRQYLTGFRADDGILVVAKRSAVLFADFRYVEAARAEARGCEVVLLTSSAAQLSALAEKLGLETAFVETEELTLARLAQLRHELPKLEFNLSPEFNAAITRMRMVKSPVEIEFIKRAQQITDAAFNYILGEIRPGVSERDIAAELEYFMKKHGSSFPAFDTIAISGESTSKPHGVPGSRRLKSGDFITMDFGASFEGYRSDMTRTVALG